MSYQPDEFATFAALAQFKPSHLGFDPRMYKYGGLWVYPVGVLLKLAGSVGLVRLNPDAAFYLDRPEEFGRFYVVARCYSAAWGLAGVVAVFLLAHRCCGNGPAAACGALCFMFMPVVITAAHEAKPHLAGTVLTLLAVLAGAMFVEHGRRRSALAAAILCGAAIGMVPSACPVLLVLPGMMVLRRLLRADGVTTTRIILNATAWTSLSALVYFVANPYVLINLVRDRAVLQSSFGNSAAFYHVGVSQAGLSNTICLIGLGTSFVLAFAGMLGGIALAWRASQVKCTSLQELRRRAAGTLLALVTLPVAIVFLFFAAKQPADYARFALSFDVFLAIEAVVAVATFVRSPLLRGLSLCVLVVTTGFTSSFYLCGFIRDSSGRSSRLADASRLDDLLRLGGRLMATREEPAPWSLPPVDLFRWELVVPPRGLPRESPDANADVTVGPANLSSLTNGIGLLTSTPISWAAKPFDMEVAGHRLGETGAGNLPRSAVH